MERRKTPAFRKPPSNPGTPTANGHKLAGMRIEIEESLESNSPLQKMPNTCKNADQYDLQESTPDTAAETINSATRFSNWSEAE